MDIRKIKKLIELLNETGISEIEIKEGEESVRLSRHHHPMENYQPQPMRTMVIPTTQQAQAAPEALPIKAHQEPAGHKIRAPMVGTLYTAASPEAPSFVSLGQHVKTGDTLCIIEAMKMFNEIEADRDGILTSIFVKNGEPVEYDQPLFIIE